MTSSRCGHQLRTGRVCQQKITGNSTRCAAGHPVTPRDETGGLSSGACEIIETEEGWACRSHDLGSEQWQVAIALGARPPCRVPGGVKKRAQMAADERSKPLTLQLLARDEDGIVRQWVADNPNTPASIIERLAGDEDREVRLGVAWNPNTPVNILKRLAEDEKWWVRRGVASNPNTPASLLEQLAGDEDWQVRGEVARNSNTPASSLKRLARDKDKWVRGPALERLS